MPFRIDLHVHTRETSPCGRTAGRLVAQLYKKPVMTELSLPTIITGVLP